MSSEYHQNARIQILTGYHTGSFARLVRPNYRQNWHPRQPEPGSVGAGQDEYTGTPTTEIVGWYCRLEDATQEEVYIPLGGMRKAEL